MRLRFVVIQLILAACCLFAGIAYANRPAGIPSVPVSQSPRVCFDVANWGPAPKRLAPCVRIRRVAEDGSFTFAVTNHDGTVRYVNAVGAQDR